MVASFTPWRRQASISWRARATFSSSGFSTITCLPASAALVANSAWRGPTNPAPMTAKPTWLVGGMWHVRLDEHHRAGSLAAVVPAQLLEGEGLALAVDAGAD